MRITGGRARGIPLAAGDSDRVRPATDRMREALFSSLGPRVEGARCLDLFAGSGAYGLEALSRGARSVLFVEQDRRTLAALKANLAGVEKSLGAGGQATVQPGDVFALQPAPSHDLIFCDPPYALIEVKAARLFDLAAAALDPATEGRFCFEMPGECELRPLGWTLVRRLGQGKGQPTVAIWARG